MREDCVSELEEWLPDFLTVTGGKRYILHHDGFLTRRSLWMYEYVRACLFVQWCLPLLPVIDFLFCFFPFFLVVKCMQHF